MKAEVKKQKAFDPITIEITLDTEDECRSLWHYINLGCDAVEENACNEHMVDAPENWECGTWELFSVLSKEMEKQGLKKED
jgi:hypothetical protein